MIVLSPNEEWKAAHPGAIIGVLEVSGMRNRSTSPYGCPGTEGAPSARRYPRELTMLRTECDRGAANGASRVTTGDGALWTLRSFLNQD